MDYSDPNVFTLPLQLTKQVRRDVYPLLEPTQPELLAKGKIVLITGVSGGIGKVSATFVTQFPCSATNRNGLLPSRGSLRALLASSSLGAKRTCLRVSPDRSRVLPRPTPKSSLGQPTLPTKPRSRRSSRPPKRRLAKSMCSSIAQAVL